MSDMVFLGNNVRLAAKKFSLVLKFIYSQWLLLYITFLLGYIHLLFYVCLFSLIMYVILKYTHTHTHSHTHCYLVAKSCLTLCNLMDCRLSGSSVRGISQTRILEWLAISFSRGSSWPRDQTCISYIGRRILSPWGHQGCSHKHTYIHSYILYSLP